MNSRSAYLLIFIAFILTGCVSENHNTGEVKTFGKAYFHTKRGISLYYEGKYDLALSYFNKAVKAETDRHDAYFYRSQLYVKQNKYELALFDINKAIDIFPDKVYLNSRGNIYYKMKKYELAIQEFKKAIKSGPNYSSAYNNLAWLLATCSEKKYRDGSNAVKYAKKAVESDSNLINLDTLAAAYAETGDFENAIRTEEEIIQKVKEGSTTELLSDYEKRLESYKRNIPWTEM